MIFRPSTHAFSLLCIVSFYPVHDTMDDSSNHNGDEVVG